MKRNGIYIASALCLALLGGVSLLLIKSPEEHYESPAEHSLDERMDQTARPFETTLPTSSPSYPAWWSERAKTEAPTSAPTAIPELTPAPSSEPKPSEPVKWASPVDGRLMRVYAMDCLIWSKTLGQWMTHSGVDIKADMGAEVRAVAEGVVERVYSDDMMGVTVIIKHENGLSTAYMGLAADPPVKEGDNVSSRALIGYIGGTAISECAEESHLHFEVRMDGAPLDPTLYTLIKKEV